MAKNDRFQDVMREPVNPALAAAFERITPEELPSGPTILEELLGGHLYKTLKANKVPEKAMIVIAGEVCELRRKIDELIEKIKERPMLCPTKSK